MINYHFDIVFPIHIGINRYTGFWFYPLNRVPYTHRDKPFVIDGDMYRHLCSLYT